MKDRVLRHSCPFAVNLGSSHSSWISICLYPNLWVVVFCFLHCKYKRKKNKEKRETNMQEYKSIIRKQVKGQNGLDVAHFSPYAERTMPVQLWEKS